MGTKNQPAPFDCYDNAEPDEPRFVLLARDGRAAELVRQWADGRALDIKHGLRPASDQAQVDEAYACARAMRAWRAQHKPLSGPDTPSPVAPGPPPSGAGAPALESPRDRPMRS